MMTFASIVVVHARPEFDPGMLFLITAVAAAVLIVPWLAWRG